VYYPKVAKLVSRHVLLDKKNWEWYNNRICGDMLNIYTSIYV
jgi:hypothetical protein